MTLNIPTTTDRAALLRAIDAQLQPTSAERAMLNQARDAQEVLLKLAQLREITVEWR